MRVPVPNNNNSQPSNSRQSSISAIGTSWFRVFLVLATLAKVRTSLLVHKYSTRVVETKYGALRGVMVHIHPPVEAFLGIPYATPPVGSLRYMPPVTPSQWQNIRLADRFGAVCPQRPPDIGNRTEALLEFPRGRLLYLEKLLPLLANQSEDCLFLNIYVPRTASGDPEPEALPCIVYVHGESYEWNSGNPYDGTALASNGRVLVVTINFRLGVLGFLKTGTKGSSQGNFGLMDLVAGLHWLKENLPAFGGDPQRVTLMGHSTGAALVNFIAVSPAAKELLYRVVLLSGSGLSPWAIQRDPLLVKRAVAEHTGCHGDLLEDDLAPCLRLKSLDQLLGVRIESPRFLPGFAPFIDGTILLNPSTAFLPSSSSSSTSSSSTVATSAGFELADFANLDLLFSLTSTESYLDLNAQDLEFGFNESRRDRVLRTYVRNSYYYHLNEIFSTLKNEYTDWERPSQNPLSVRDAALDVLSDGHTAAPLIRVGYLHALKGGKTFFMHFQHQTGERDFPMRSGSVRGEDLPYVLGLPLIEGGFFMHNYSRTDIEVSKTIMHYLSNFAKNGDPNGGVPNAPDKKNSIKAEEVDKGTETPYWDTYDTINQLYLELGNRAEMKNHYRGHKMSLWLNLIPQLHRPGVEAGDDVSMRHHHFQEEGEQYYDGSVRAQTNQKPSFIHVIPQPSLTTSMSSSTSTTPSPPKSDTAVQATTTECPPNSTLNIQGVAKNSNNNNNHNNLLRRLASNQYQSYTTALTVTIAVGCFLLLLNVLIFAGIYHQRDRGRRNRKKKEEQGEAGSCSSSSTEPYGKSFESCHMSYDCSKNPYQLKRGNSFECTKSIHHCYDTSDYEKRGNYADVQMAELPLQQFSSSPVKRPPESISMKCATHQQPPDVTNSCVASQTTDSDENYEDEDNLATSPPTKAATASNQAGILRAQGAPTTPGTMKKRVQIQEISV